MMRLRIPPVVGLYTLLLVVECTVLWVAFGYYREFETRVYDLREGYLHEISSALEGPLAHLIDEAPATSEALEPVFRPFVQQAESALPDVSMDHHPALEIGVWSRDGHCLYQSHSPSSCSERVPSPDIETALSGRTSRRDETLEDRIVMHVVSPIRSGDQIVGVLETSKSNALLKPLVDHVERWLAILCLGVLILMVFLTLSFYLFLCRPLEIWIYQALQERTGQEFALRPVLRRQRFGRLGLLIDRMMEYVSEKRHLERVVPYLAHELKNPLSAISLHLERLNRNDDDQARRHLYEEIGSSVRQMNDVTRRLLCMGALEKTENLRQRSLEKMAVILDMVAAERRVSAEKNEVRLVFECPEDIEVSCDRILIKQAIGNLVQNAIDHSGKNGIVSIRVFVRSHLLVCQVRDHGAGIPKAALPHVFDRFYSLRKTASGQEGDGVGLFFVKETADLHGGRVSLRNHPDGGAVAELSIPSCN